MSILGQKLAPVKILHVITDLQIGGAETMLYRLMASTDRDRFRHVVVSLTDRGTLGATIAELEIPVYALGMRSGWPDPRALWRLARLIRQERPMILQTWLYHADLLGLIAGKLAAVPAIVWTVRCSNVDMRHYPWHSRCTRRILSLLSRFPTAVVVNSERGRRAHEELGYRPRRWVTIPNGIDVTRFRPDPEARNRLRREIGISLRARLIGMAGRYDPMKDHETFLRAAALLLSRITVTQEEAKGEVHFVLIGRGVTWENPEFASLARRLRIAGRLHLLGERSDVDRLLPGLDVATLSSSFGEGWPNVVGEAMACGVPCIVTDVGDAATVVGETGRVVPPRDPQALAGAWAELLNLPEDERRALGEAAHKRIVENFSIERVTKQYELLWEELTSVQARPRETLESR